MKTIKIKDTNYNIKPTIKALFVWEQIMQKAFKLESTLDNYVYFYSLLFACNPDFMTWDEFIDELDSDSTIIANINAVLTNQNEIDKIFESEEEDSAGKKKD